MFVREMRGGERMACVVPSCVGMPDVDEDVWKRKACFDVDDAYVEKLRKGKIGNEAGFFLRGRLLAVRRPNCISAIFCLIGSYL